MFITTLVIFLLLLVCCCSAFKSCAATDQVAFLKYQCGRKAMFSINGEEGEEELVGKERRALRAIAAR